jgi:hypothetical protein
LAWGPSQRRHVGKVVALAQSINSVPYYDCTGYVVELVRLYMDLGSDCCMNHLLISHNTALSMNTTLDLNR